MKKKHLLTVLCLSTFIFGAQAQWPDTYRPRTVDKTNKDIATIDAAGNVIVAGTFTEDFSFGTTDLTPTASSTYLIKYNAAGQKQWAVSFKGKTQYTAMTTDNDGNIYVAGQYADEVIFGSTDNVTSKVTGIGDGWGGVVSELGAGFLAKYNSSGVLVKVQALKPEAFPEVTADPGAFYLQDLQFAIRSLKFVNGTLYASAVFTGILNNAGLPLSASYLIQAGMAVDVFSGAIFSVNVSDLNISQVIATLASPVDSQGQHDVRTALFDITPDNLLYALFYASGGSNYGSTHTLNVLGNTEDFVFSDGGSITYEAGHIFAVVNLSGTPAKVSSGKTYLSTARDYVYFLQSACISGNHIFLSGGFKEPLVFDNTLTGNGKTDVFAVAIHKTDLTQAFARQAGANDGTFASAAIYNDKLNIAYNETAAKSSGIFSVSLTDGTGSAVSEATANTYTNSLFAANGKLVTVKATTSAVNTDLSTVSVSTADVTTPTGIRNPKAAAVSFYPNPVTSVIYLSAHGNIDVYNSLGILVKQAVAVDQLNVENLHAGIYFATVKAAGNTTNIKFIKK